MSWIEDEDKQKKENLVTDDSKQLWTLLEKTLNDNLIEKRRARRWKIFFRLTSLFILIAVIGFWFNQSSMEERMSRQDVVALIPMSGVIGSKSEIEGNEYVDILDRAYKNPHLKGVVIDMNSPGGSPVQAGIIYDAIRKKEKQFPTIPIIVVVEDMAASGGYYIASAANEIYADKASLVGSIGVISSGFDVTELMKKIGVQRRTFTAGRNKDFLDPFEPMTAEGKQKWQAVLDETHQQFIHAVKVGRGHRLKITDDVFSGMVFTGAQAEKMGLIDGLASLHDVLQSKFPNDKQIIYGPKKDPIDEIAKKFGVEFATKLLSTVTIQ